MKTLMILTLSALALSQAAQAKDPRPAVTVKKGDTNVVVTLTGPAAQTLYNALEVQPEGHFGFIQTMTKKTERVECERAQMGDEVGRMSEPRFTCTITEELR